MMRAVLCAIGVAMMLHAPQERPSPTRVWVHATVVDAQGRVVTGLRQEDFTIKDNDTVRPIVVFSTDELPVAMSLMLDISGSMVHELPLVRMAAELLIDQFIDGDRVNVGAFKSEINHELGFTANRMLILKAIDDAMMLGAVPCVNGTGQPKPGGTWMWDAIECGIKVLRRDGEAFRRVLVLVTDGKENGGYATGSTAIQLATQSGVLIYAVGLKGVGGRADALLRDLTAATGGGYLPIEQPKEGEKSDYRPAFKQIAEELHGQYVMAFDSKPGASGKLSVTVNKPGLKVRARRGYQVK